MTEHEKQKIEEEKMRLEQEIDSLKISINSMIGDNPKKKVNSTEILELSKKLDELIRIYYRLNGTSR